MVEKFRLTLSGFMEIDGIGYAAQGQRCKHHLTGVNRIAVFIHQPFVHHLEGVPRLDIPLEIHVP